MMQQEFRSSSEFFITPKKLNSKSFFKDDSSQQHQQKFYQNQDNYLLTNFIKVYFSFAYYLGMSPFRFGVDKNGEIILKSFWLQKVNNTNFNLR